MILECLELIYELSTHSHKTYIRLSISLTLQIVMNLIKNIAYIFLCVTSVIYVPSGIAGFDVKTLSKLGFDSKVADFFSEDSRFLPGNHQVKISINMSDYLDMDVFFNEAGIPCFKIEDLNKLSIKNQNISEECKPITDLIPGVKLRLFPEETSIEIIVPEEFIDKRTSLIKREGSGAIINYSLFGQEVNGPYSRYNYLQGQSDYGFNTHGWIVRNKLRGVYNNQKWHVMHEDLNARKAVEPFKSIMQLGQIYTNGQLLVGIPLTGFEFFTDDAQNADNKLIVPLKGVANSNATVEVAQRGRTIYRTIVPPGEFTINTVTGLVQGTPIDLIIREEDGQTHTLSIPNNIRANSSQGIKYNLGAGRYRYIYNKPEKADSPLVMVGGVSQTNANQLTLANSILISEEINKTSTQLSYGGFERAYVSSGIEISKFKKMGNGFIYRNQLQYALPDNLTLGMSWAHQSRNYFDENEVLGQENSDFSSSNGRPKDFYNASLSWSGVKMGAYSYSIVKQTYHNYKDSIIQTLSSAHKFNTVTLNASFQRTSWGNSSVYVGLSFPLVNGKVKTRAQNSNSTLTLGTNYRNNLADGSAYSMDFSGTENAKRVSGTLSSSTPYTQVGIVASKNNQSSNSYSATMSGGMALVGNNFAMSPQSIGDTFSIVEIKGQKDVKISTPGSGSLKTTRSGKGIITKIQPYIKTETFIDTRSLPLNARIDSTTIDFTMARGAVDFIKVPVSEYKQLLLTVKDSEGNILPTGYSYYDTEGHFIGTVIGDGNIMLVNDDIGKNILLSIPNKGKCKINYTLPSVFDADKLYEESVGICE